MREIQFTCTSSLFTDILQVAGGNELFKSCLLMRSPTKVAKVKRSGSEKQSLGKLEVKFATLLTMQYSPLFSVCGMTVRVKYCIFYLI